MIWIVSDSITGNSIFKPLLEGLLAQIHTDLRSQGFDQDRTVDQQIAHICVGCRALITSANVINESMKIYRDPILNIYI